MIYDEGKHSLYSVCPFYLSTESEQEQFMGNKATEVVFVKKNLILHIFIIITVNHCWKSPLYIHCLHLCYCSYCNGKCIIELSKIVQGSMLHGATLPILTTQQSVFLYDFLFVHHLPYSHTNWNVETKSEDTCLGWPRITICCLVSLTIESSQPTCCLAKPTKSLYCQPSYLCQKWRGGTITAIKKRENAWNRVNVAP